MNLLGICRTVKLPKRADRLMPEPDGKGMEAFQPQHSKLLRPHSKI
jgi:hypothetical protein